jgi:hypothetical protein
MTRKSRESNVHIKIGGSVNKSVVHAGDINIGLPKFRLPFGKKKAAAAPADEATLELIDTLSKRFSMDELEQISLEMGIEFDDLPARTRSGKARQLVQHADTLKRREKLNKIVRRERPE